MDTNKLKKAVTGIKMPEETAQKIISACRECDNSPADSAEYSQQVSGVEKAEHRNFFRFTAIAAALVLAVGAVTLSIGLLNRNKPSENSDLYFAEAEPQSQTITDITSSAAVETTETTEATTQAEEEKISFVSLEKLYAMGMTIKYTYGDKPMPDLTLEQCRLLDKFFVSAIDSGEIKESTAERHFAQPTMKFETYENNELSCFIYIYSPEYLAYRGPDNNTTLYCYIPASENPDTSLHAKIETIFRNGSLVDDGNLYPPFGNFAKMSSEPYKIIFSDNSSGTPTKNELFISPDVLHQAFYGYDWAACETTEMQSDSERVITIPFKSERISSTVTVDDNGFVSWYENNSSRFYQLPGNMTFDVLMNKSYVEE